MKIVLIITILSLLISCYSEENASPDKSSSSNTSLPPVEQSSDSSSSIAIFREVQTNNFHYIRNDSSYTLRVIRQISENIEPEITEILPGDDIEVLDFFHFGCSTSPNWTGFTILISVDGKTIELSPATVSIDKEIRSEYLSEEDNLYYKLCNYRTTLPITDQDIFQAE